VIMGLFLFGLAFVVAIGGTALAIWRPDHLEE
jgi:hypothetical protein